MSGQVSSHLKGTQAFFSFVPGEVSSHLKGTRNEDMSSPENIEGVQIFAFAGFVW